MGKRSQKIFLNVPGLFRKRVFFKIAASALGISAALISIELVLHLIWDSPRLPVPPGLLRNDPHTVVAHVPNFDGELNSPHFRIRIQINNLGLRDLDRPYEKPPGVVRLLAIGDSYVEGHGVAFDDIFLRRAEAMLADKLRGHFELQIIKAGVGGWGPINELEFLKNEGFRYNPDAVLVAFFTGNDYTDAPDQFVVYRGIRLEKSRLSQITPLMDFRIGLRKRVYLYGLLVDCWKALAMPAAQKMSEDAEMLRLCLPEETPPLPLTSGAIEGFQQWSFGHKIPIHFLILPHRIQIEAGRARAVAAQLELDAGALDFNRPSRHVREILDRHSIPYLDVTAQLREHAVQTGPIGLSSDSHYNSDTHAILGEIVAHYAETTIFPGLFQSDGGTRNASPPPP